MSPGGVILSALCRYFRVMSGHIGPAKIVSIKRRADFDAATKGIISQGESAGLDPRALAAEIDALETAYKLLTRTSIESNVHLPRLADLPRAEGLQLRRHLPQVRGRADR